MDIEALLTLFIGTCGQLSLKLNFIQSACWLLTLIIKQCNSNVNYSLIDSGRLFRVSYVTGICQVEYS